MTEAGWGTDATTDLGRCPRCRERIPSENLVIRYEPDDGWPTIFAACAACASLVSPL